MSILIISIIAAIHFLAGDGGCVEVPVLRQTTGKSLQFSGDSKFKIALFADLHYGENAWTEWGPAQDEKSERVIAAVLDKETPGQVICNSPLYFC